MSVTLKDIARETGLSIATISKYINGIKLKEKNRIIIEQTIDRLGYTVNEYARGLKSNKSRTIGVIIPELSNLFITQIITMVEKILRAQSYSIIICDCHTNEDIECDAVKFLLSKRVDGIINMPVCTDGRHLAPAIENNIPIVIVDRAIPELSGIVDSVLIDNAAATCAATTHILEKGHRNIGIIVGPGNIFTSQLRLEGYRNALRAYGVTPSDNLIQCSDYTLHGGFESLNRLLSTDNEMTAVFVTNYEMTLGAVMAINEASVQVPERLSFIGFDSMELSLIATPKMTVVSQPLAEMGSEIARLMLERLTGDKRTVPVSLSLNTELLLGNSVKSL